MKRLGIHFRLIVAVFTLITATTFVLGYMGIKISRQFIQTRFDERVSFLARYLALNAELGILIDDRLMLDRLATNLLSEIDVTGVTIFDRNGNELSSRKKQVSGPFSMLEAPVFLRESQEESKAFKWETNGGQNERLIGKVRIVYSTRGIDKLLRTMGHRFIWLSAGLACLSGLIFYFISRSLVSPVTKLAQAARDVAKGDLNLRAEPGGLPEARELALAFNAMLDSLAGSRKALEKANEEMIRKNALAELGKFSLMIAHEVKNPLSIIKSSLDVLKESKGLSSDETMVFYIEDEIRRLNRLIEDFLLFARPTQPFFRQVDVNSLVNEIVVRFDLQKSRPSVEIQTSIPSEACYAYVDPDLLTRAIGNVLKNAIESNSENGVVKVSTSKENAIWSVEIEDQGEGIDPENMNRIFEPFYTTRSKGTGLGLAYAFQVTSAHNGKITVKNNEHGGALFRIEMPVYGEVKN